MITVMDMTTGKIIDDEFGRFEDEVLNAEWLPPQAELQPGLQLGLQLAQHAEVPARRIDAASFLERIYRAQE